MNAKSLLSRERVFLADGGLGTELQKRGLAAGEVPELWNAERPADVEAVAASYVEAGADVVLTNTFGGNRFKLTHAALADRLEELNRLGVEAARRAAGDRALVFASVGPTGEFMAPLGTVSEDELIEVFAEQAAACLEAGADGIVAETMTDLGEALAALKGARRAGAEVVVVSMTYDAGPRGYATMMGQKPADVAVELAAAGADIVGANCGTGIDNMIGICAEMRGATDRPIWTKSNAGLPQLVDGRTVFRETPDQMAARVRELVDAGADIIGGCCGTTPEHIRRIAEVLAGLQQPVDIAVSALPKESRPCSRSLPNAST